MPIERFSTLEFINFVESLGYPYTQGWEYAEYVWTLEVTDKARIKIRSSIGKNGIAASTGQNSIRFYLEDSNGKLLWGNMDSIYTTRVPGWQERGKERVEYLKDMADKAGECYCGNIPRIMIVRKLNKNKGRLFVSCRKCDYFNWIT